MLFRSQIHRQTDRRTYRQTDRQTDRERANNRPTDRRTDRQTDRQTDRPTERLAHRETNRHITDSYQAAALKSVRTCRAIGVQVQPFARQTRSCQTFFVRRHTVSGRSYYSSDRSNSQSRKTDRKKAKQQHKKLDICRTDTTCQSYN